ncbi:secretory calcium-binding phosphoprotein proline-glutamine rich 1 isoform X1 [Anolis carolinensis]|uniref:secretory calcium-binding phosphoprotein proline-glutamine rich 1 isoform X1 n=1 Tax=Anolis carolinensis TaxID=28377 RepID=UPI002F2B8B7A
MKLLVLLSCILAVAVAGPVRRSASSSEERRRGPQPMIPPMYPQFPPQFPAQFPPQFPAQPNVPPQMIPIPIPYDPAQVISKSLCKKYFAKNLQMGQVNIMTSVMSQHINSHHINLSSPPSLQDLQDLPVYCHLVRAIEWSTVPFQVFLASSHQHVPA